MAVPPMISDMGISSPDRLLHVKPEDYGIHLSKTSQGYFNITSDRMIFESDIEKHFSTWLGSVTGDDFQPVFTYLANAIADDGREIPYSTITAIDFTSAPPLGPFLSTEGLPLKPLGEHEIALNTWAADDLKAKIGDTIKITYFAPESIHGQIQEKTAEFKLAAIVKLSGAADDRLLTPAVKGITDELTMADWNPPFPFDAKRIRPQDEQYWNEHGPTPKALVSLESGRKLWASRFGQTTSLRIASAEEIPETTKKEFPNPKLKYVLEWDFYYDLSLGFTWQPVKLQGLAAAQGTTPFNVLFLGFSFFIIVSALMLVLLLFKLGVERRAAEIGILLAVGWKPKRVRKLLFREGVLTAVCGGLLGVPLGIGYAALMLWGLQTWWLAAIVTPFLKLYITPGSLAIGFFAGFFMGLVTIYFAVRKISRIAPRRLLAGIAHDARERQSPDWLPFSASRSTPTATPPIWRLAFPGGLWLIFFAANVLFWFFARKLSDLEAGMFFGSGAIMLLLTLLVLWNRLRRGATGAAVALGGGNLFRLAIRNAARSPGRSTLTIGLVASACFLIVAVSAFNSIPRNKRQPSKAATADSLWSPKAASRSSKTSTRPTAARRSASPTPKKKPLHHARFIPSVSARATTPVA